MKRRLHRIERGDGFADWFMMEPMEIPNSRREAHFVGYLHLGRVGTRHVLGADGYCFAGQYWLTSSIKTGFFGFMSPVIAWIAE